jgi:archaemetzincin
MANVDAGSLKDETRFTEQLGLGSLDLVELTGARLGQGDDESMLIRRAVTEAVHELGHVWGLGHCTRNDCVMWFSNTLAETDRKGNKFCQHCAGQLVRKP